MKKRLFQVLCLILLVLMLPLSQKISGTQILAADEGAVQIGAENPKYTFNTIDGESITTQSEGDGRTTVLVFGFTTCGRTKTTLKNIIASPLITAEDTRTIFIEVTGADRSEVADFKEIDCQDTSDKIIYCYHETMGTVEKVRNDYLQRLGGNTQSYKYPVIILIDKNNRARQFIQTGNSVGADVLKAEIDKLADPDPGNPSSGPESPIPTTPPGLGEDPDYTFCSIGGEKIPTTYRETPKKNTVLIFGKTNCGKTKATVQEIASSSWAGNDNIRVLFAEATGKTQAETAAFAERYNGSPITFCYDDGKTGLDSIYNAMFRYARFNTEIGNSVSFPLIVLIDEHDRVRKVVQGYQNEGYIKGELDQIMNPSDPSDTTPEPLPTATPKPNPVKTGLPSIISGNTVSLEPSPGKTTTLIFGTIAAGQPENGEVRSMVAEDPSDWASRIQLPVNIRSRPLKMSWRAVYTRKVNSAWSLRSAARRPEKRL